MLHRFGTFLIFPEKNIFKNFGRASIENYNCFPLLILSRRSGLVTLNICIFCQKGRDRGYSHVVRKSLRLLKNQQAVFSTALTEVKAAHRLVTKIKFLYTFKYVCVFWESVCKVSLATDFVPVQKQVLLQAVRKSLTNV